MVGSAHLTVRREEEVLEALINWVKFRPHERAGFLADLLTQIRLHLIPKWRLHGRFTHEDLLRNDPACLRELEQATALQERMKSDSLSDEERLVSVPRQPLGQPHKILVFSGKALSNRIQQFDIAVSLLVRTLYRPTQLKVNIFLFRSKSGARSRLCRRAERGLSL
jgi:hypothetical protein